MKILVLCQVANWRVLSEFEFKLSPLLSIFVQVCPHLSIRVNLSPLLSIHVHFCRVRLQFKSDIFIFLDICWILLLSFYFADFSTLFRFSVDFLDVFQLCQNRRLFYSVFLICRLAPDLSTISKFYLRKIFPSFQSVTNFRDGCMFRKLSIHESRIG